MGPSFWSAESRAHSCAARDASGSGELVGVFVANADHFARPVADRVVRPWSDLILAAVDVHDRGFHKNGTEAGPAENRLRGPNLRRSGPLRLVRNVRFPRASSVRSRLVGMRRVLY